MGRRGKGPDGEKRSERLSAKFAPSVLSLLDQLAQKWGSREGRSVSLMDVLESLVQERARTDLSSSRTWRARSWEERAVDLEAMRAAGKHVHSRLRIEENVLEQRLAHRIRLGAVITGRPTGWAEVVGMGPSWVKGWKIEGDRMVISFVTHQKLGPHRPERITLPLHWLDLPEAEFLNELQAVHEEKKG